METGEHFRQCLRYVDLNMVRAGVLSHPEEWPNCEYAEIQPPKVRWRIIDEEQLINLAHVPNRAMLQQLCWEQVKGAFERKLVGRQSRWTESIAFGSSEYIEALQKQLGVRAKGRERLAAEGSYQLKEAESAYVGFSGQKGLEDCVQHLEDGAGVGRPTLLRTSVVNRVDFGAGKERRKEIDGGLSEFRTSFSKRATGQVCTEHLSRLNGSG